MKSFRDKITLNSIREIMAIAEKMDGVIQLQIGEPSVNTPKHIRNAAIRAMEEEFTHYTPNAGLLSTREAISRRLARDYGLDIATNRIIVTAGAVSSLNISLLSLVNPNEEVLIPDPTYPNYEGLCRLQGAVPVYYPTKKENDFLPEMSDIERLITPYTKAMIVNSPNNPTGAVYSRDKWMEIIELAEKHDIYIISDEIYDEIIFTDKHICPLALSPIAHHRVISIFGFSKVYAMTGWRLAYAVVPDELFTLMCKLQEPVTTCASSISQKAGEAALDGPQEFVVDMRNKYRKNRDKACEILSKFNMDFIKPDGALYISIDISKTNMSSMEFAISFLKEKKVAVAPCSSFGPSGNQLIRICFAGDEASLAAGLERLGEFYVNKIKQVSK